jgi:hypothetical protein
MAGAWLLGRCVCHITPPPALQANPFFVDWLSSKDGTLFVCQLVDRLVGRLSLQPCGD